MKSQGSNCPLCGEYGLFKFPDSKNHTTSATCQNCKKSVKIHINGQGIVDKIYK